MTTRLEVSKDIAQSRLQDLQLHSTFTDQDCIYGCKTMFGALVPDSVQMLSKQLGQHTLHSTLSATVLRKHLFLMCSHKGASYSRNHNVVLLDCKVFT